MTTPPQVHALLTRERMFAAQHTTLADAVRAAEAGDRDDGAVTHVAVYKLVEVVEIAEARRRVRR